MHLTANSDVTAPFARFINLMRRNSVVISMGLVVLAISAAARADNVDGAWTAVHGWPLISVHAALTPDGRVLTYGTNGDGKQTGYFIYDI